jgi:signal transduction histidine kinase
MSRRLHRLTLGAWLALGFAVAVIAPALSAGATYWIVDAHQRADIDQRLDRAETLLNSAGTSLDDPAVQARLVRELAALRVEADVQPAGIKAALATKAAIARSSTKALLTDGGVAGAMPPGFATKALLAARKGSDAKRALLGSYETRAIANGPLVGTLFVERPSAAVRVAAAAGAGLLALALALVAGFVLLRRWVVRPLARLAADADRIAGGELDVTPVDSRAREIADVAEALRGMAGGLRGALATQRAAEEQRRFLVSAIAHDLRTPLFTLRGSLEAIEHGIGNGDQLRRAQAKATLLDRLVGDLFTFSRLEYAGPGLALEPLDAAALAREAADTVDGRIVVIASEELWVDGDRAALVRVLVNLLDNAVRHARARVELHVARDGDDVVFTVLDDGQGIAAEDLPQLFDPLFRADRTRNSATGGAGLGLAIVQRLTAAHGGSVSADHRPEGGARFTVRLPADRSVRADRDRAT